MITRSIITIIITTLFSFASGSVYAESLARITDEVTTEFGVYRPVLVDAVPSVEPYVIENNFSNVSNFSDFTLSEEAIELLSTNGFACTASRYRQLYDIFNECMDSGIPVFVTTDACLHTYHIMYDYMLRILEVNYFYDDLVNLTDAMIIRTTEFYTNATETTVKQAALDATAYLMVAMSLLESDKLGEYDLYIEVQDVVTQEVEQILALSDGYVASPLFYNDDYPYREDYSQYRPRGHYTRSEKLERFFRVMMWYGRITFSLDLPSSTMEGLRRNARQAILLAHALAVSKVGEEDAAVVWDRIYQPTVFFVGKMDDLTYQPYLEVAGEVFGEHFPGQLPDMLADDTAMDSFITKALDELPDPEITVVAGKGLRFMGQRYIPDSYVLDQLVFDNVDDRLMPRGLDVMAALGSARAYEILDTIYEDTKYPKYIEQMVKLRNMFVGYTPKIWAQNLYYNWLYTLLPLLDVKGDGYPMFMQNQAWVDKDLNTSLGSWAELRHDTILYAKQSETYETSMPSEPPYVMGYVEPDPEVYARLAALADFMRRGLENRGLMDSEIETRLMKYENLMLALKNIAEKELQNSTPTPEEFALICNFGSTIESITTFPKEYASQFENEADDFMAVIADVHTDPNTNTALEVGVGHPLNIYVIAPVNGVPTLTMGGIFSYHEFTWLLADERLTDEEWQALQSGVNAQLMPVWTESFIAGESSARDITFHHLSEGRLVTGVGKDTEPVLFELRQNRPNPFNPSTTISYRLDVSGPVMLAVYNLTGQLVEVLVEGWQEPGEFDIVWTPHYCSSGVYIVRIVHGQRSESMKIVYMK
ncbi:MAG TPA: DUF3160 domain-containing protein [Anaerolineae bacterium]|nr:DUF3160 domain-containing protein [Anaerolineae bacterium]